MQQPGRSVPFLFDNFKPDQPTTPPLPQLAQQSRQTARVYSPGQSREEVLQIIATIVQQLVGSQVCWDGPGNYNALHSKLN
jgi:hypothetical protein